MTLLSIDSVEGLTVKSLYESYIRLVEVPFSSRLLSFFHFVDSDGDDLLTFQEVIELFSYVYWQEACCFVTGELGSSQGFMLLSSFMA